MPAPAVGGEQDGVGGEHDHQAEQERDRRRVVHLLAGEGEGVGVQVGRVGAVDDARREPLQQLRLGEQLEAADHREDAG